MEMDLAGQIKILAFYAVSNGTAEYRLRHIYRWYSAKFATPLHLVPRLPFTDILTAYFEDQFEQLDAEELEEERRLMVETESQRKARLAEIEAQEAADVDFAAFADAEAKRLESTAVPVQTAVRPVAHPHKQAPEATLPETQTIPADVSVKFVEENFFDDLVDKLDQT